MITKQYLEQQADRVEALLAAQRCPARVVGGSAGPRLIRFVVRPAPYVRVAAIKKLSDDLALALRVASVKLSSAPDGVLLEFANPQPRNVGFLEVLAGLQPLPAATVLLGLQADGVPLLAKLSSPEVAHVLIAGTTGAGKSVLLRAIAGSLIFSNSREALSIIAVDPKNRTFPVGFKTAHFVRPVLSEPEQIGETLRSLVRLMEIRDKRRETLPRVAVFVDELADTVMTVECATASLTRLLQRGREAGIHVIAATQRPSAAVLSGLMRANFPLRLVGRVISPEDARIAAGRGGCGAERLIGRGDFLAVGSDIVRFQVPFLSVEEMQQHVGQVSSAISSLDLPAVEEEIPGNEEEIALLAKRLRPWWEHNGNRWGAKTGALRHLFGDVPAGGWQWQRTMEAISQLETA